MKKIYTTLVFVIAIFCNTQQAKAQGIVKQINFISYGLKNTMPADVSSWGTIPGGLYLVVQKLPQANVTGAKLVIQIEQNGTKVCGNTVDNAAAVDINGTKNFSANELLGALGQCPPLKAGSYTLCVQFFNVDRFAISEKKCKDFAVESVDQSLQNYSVPTNISPANNQQLKENEAKAPITFRWTPIVPKPRDPVTYRLKVWQIEEGQTGSQAMRTNQPIVTKDVDNITQSVERITWPCGMTYGPRCPLVWAVEAFSKDAAQGKERSLGKSEPTIFYKENEIKIETRKITNVEPANKATIIAKDADTPMVFRWTPIVPKPQEPVTYRLKVWQLMQGQSAEQTMRTKKPIVTKDVADITEVNVEGRAICNRLPCPYTDIVWNVEASKVNKMGEVEVLGTSEPSTFKTGSTTATASTCPGTWGAIQVGTSTALGTTLIPSTLLPSMPMGSTFFINTCYTCPPGCGTPTIVYEMYDAFTNLLVGTSTPGTNCGTTAFNIPTGLSTTTGYTFKIFTYCCGAICDSSLFQFSPLPPVVSTCCTGSSWGSMQWCNSSTSPCPLTALPPCNGSLGVLNASSIVNFNIAYNCAIGCTPGQLMYNIYDASGTLFSSSTAASGSNIGIAMPSIVGGYNMTIYSICGGIRCDSCKYQFSIVSCCTGGSWSVKKWGFTATTPNPLVPFSSIAAGCNPNLYFNVNYTCATSCTSNIVYKFYNSSAAVIATFTYPPGLTPAVPIPSTATYFQVFAQCGTQFCDSILNKITITPACAGSSWGPRFYRPAPLPSLPWQTLPCSSSLLPMHVGSITKFRAFYNCTCGPTTLKYIINGPGGYTWSSPSMPSGATVNAVMPPTLGPATVTILAYCNGVLCNKCIDKLVIVP
jgi:hypothetical protein